jgi:hypothetical protein
MIKRITIENYMAHRHTVLDLGPGVTVLTGPNNVGKSAVVEAIRSVAQNPAPEHVIRHGAGQAVVRVELDSGEIIEWVRKKASAVYRLYRPAAASDPPEAGSGDAEGEAEVYAKFGRTPPDDIRQLLRLDLVDTETGPVDIHIGNQRYPIFLLDESGSQAASFFAASTEAEYLLRMRQALKTRTDSSKRQVRELQLECARLEKELERYLPLEQLNQDLVRAEELHAALATLQQALPLLVRALHLLAAAETQYAGTQRCCEALSGLAEPPLLVDTVTLASRLVDLESTRERMSLTRSLSGVLSPLAEPPPLLDNQGLVILVSGLASTQDFLQHHGRLCATLEQLATPPDLRGIAPLVELTTALEQAERGHVRAAAAESSLRELSAPPQTHDTARLEAFIRQWEGAAGQQLTASRCVEELDVLKSPPVARDTSGLEILIERISDGERRRQRIERRQTILDEVRPCPESLEVTRLEEIAGRLAQWETAARVIRQEQEACLTDLEALGREIQEALGVAGTCPLCGQTLDLQHFLEVPHE